MSRKNRRDLDRKPPVEGKEVSSSMEPCYQEEDLAMLASGQFEDRVSEAMLQHIAECEECGLKLQRIAAAFDPEVTEKEEEELSRLASSQVPWQRQMAGEMAKEAKPLETQSSIYWKIAAVAVILVGLAGVLSVLFGPDAPEELLAQAYTEARPFEYRLPDAGYAPVRLTRAAAASRLNQAPELLEAEVRIVRELAEDPEDPHWLQMRGRSEILRWNYRDAISSLRRSLEIEPDDSELKADLALALALRAESEERSVDYAEAVEWLLESLKAEPASPEALFNLALIYERMLLFEEARDTWEKYLSLDPTSGFATEAREHLERLRRRAGVTAPSTDPASFLAASRSGTDLDDEFYLTAALSDWLRREGDGQAQTALEVLAHSLVEKHGDSWLSEFLARGRNPLADPLLSESIQDNIAGRHPEALRKAREAKVLYGRAGNRAGALRAGVEGVYSMQRHGNPQRCVDAALELDAALEDSDFPWIQTQNQIALGACYHMSGFSGQGIETLRAAGAMARLSSFGDLELRATGITADLELESGNPFAVWEAGLHCLETYWAGFFPANRGQQCYLILAFSAQDLGLPMTAQVFAEAGVLEISRTPNQLLEATSRMTLASLAAEAGDDSSFADQIRRADELFSALEENEASSEYLAFGRLKRATAAVSSGDLKSAREQLSVLEPMMDPAPTFNMGLEYFQTLGFAHLKARNLGKARHAFEQALQHHDRMTAELESPWLRRWAEREKVRTVRGLVEIELSESGDVAAALKFWERYRYAARADSQQASLWQRTMEIDDETFLAYASLPEGFWAWVYNAQGIEGVRLDVSENELGRSARRLVRACSDPMSFQSAIDRDARQLYDWLIKPLEHHLGKGRTLIIEPDGVVGSVPFAVLMDGDGVYLGGRYSLVISNGLGEHLNSHARMNIQAGSRALVVAAPALGGFLGRDYPRLPSAAAEGEDVVALFERGLLLHGEHATIQQLEEVRNGVELFHFAGHGFASGDGGALLFAPGDPSGITGRLAAENIALQDWSHCRLAVLSACYSAVGGDQGPVNPRSLVNAFLSAGAGGVIATQWTVDDRVSRKLIGDFYGRLLSGRSPAEALAGAVRQVRNADPSSHPYYWAGYQLYGG